MVHRWIVVDHGVLTEYPKARPIYKKYNCTEATLYARIKKNNTNVRSPIFGKHILIYRLPGEFGDPIDIDDLPTNGTGCDMCGTPVRYKDVMCEKCDKDN